MANITAPTLTLRGTKGSPLTNAEVDANFSNISAAIATGLTAASYTAADVLAKLVTVDGSGSGLDADLLDGMNSSATNVASTIVARDATGNTALNGLTLAGALSGTTGTFSGAVTVGSISISSGSIPVSVGGTGATTAAGARTNLNLVIGTDIMGYDAELAALASVTSAADKIPYFTGAGSAAVTNFTSYARTLVGAADASTARATLNLIIGTDVQGYDGDLSAIAGLAGASGVYVKTAANTAALRTITGTTNRIVVTNGDGAAGNPTIDVSSDVALLSSTQTFSGNKTFSGTTTLAVTSHSGAASFAGDITSSGTNSFSGVQTFSNSNSFTGATNTFKAVVGDSFTTTSDARLKENVETLNNAVEVVNSLRGVSYLRDGKKEIGLIAQEVEQVLPEVIGETEGGFKTVAYSNMVGLLIEAIKEQQATIKELTTRLEKLEN